MSIATQVRRRRHSRGSTAAPRSPARRATPSSSPADGIAYAAAVTATIAAGEIDADRRRARARAARRPRGHLPRQRAPARRDRRRRAAALPVRHRPLPRADRRRRGRRDAGGGPRGAPRRCGSTTRPATTTSSSTPLTRASTSRRRSTRRSRPTPSRATPRPRSHSAEVQVDETYATAPIHNNAMEPHASFAVWEGDEPHAPRLDPGHLRRAPHRSPRCSTSTPSTSA